MNTLLEVHKDVKTQYDTLKKIIEKIYSDEDINKIISNYKNILVKNLQKSDSTINEKNL